MDANVLGRPIKLGYSQVDLIGYQLVSEQPAPGHPGQVLVRAEPASEAAARVFERLVKRRTKARRPPPPSPRKGRKGGKQRHGRKRR